MRTAVLPQPEPAAPADLAPLVDGFGRTVRDLRLSVTDRCGLRCTYCMPAAGLPWLPRSELLTDDELVRLVGLLTRTGVDTVRVTGGEPLLRPELPTLLRRLAALPRRPRLSLTSNGVALAGLAASLRAAGVERVNVSLDTLRPERFRALTRRDRLPDVLAGLAAARAAGFHPVKVNTVLLRGVNDDDAVPLLEFCLHHGYQLRFIEQMPLDPQHGFDRATLVTGDEILAALRTRFRLSPLDGRGAAPAALWQVDDGPGTVGVIASVTAPFCAACDRLRLTADGALRTCLFARTETDLRTPLRAGAPDDVLVALIRTAVRGKTAGHGIGEPGFVQPSRPMSAIGG